MVESRYCGCGSDLTVDHVKPVSKGGLWEWSNLVTACNKCNGKKGSKTLKQLGWKLKRIPIVSVFINVCVHKHIMQEVIPPARSSQYLLTCFFSVAAVC